MVTYKGDLDHLSTKACLYSYGSSCQQKDKRISMSLHWEEMSFTEPGPFHPVLFLQLRICLAGHAVSLLWTRTWLTQLRRVEGDPKLEPGCWLWSDLLFWGDCTAWSHWGLELSGLIWAAILSQDLQKAETIDHLCLPQSSFCILFFVSYLSMFFPLVQFNSRAPSPIFSFFMKCTFSGRNKSMKCRNILVYLGKARAKMTFRVGKIGSFHLGLPQAGCTQ